MLEYLPVYTTCACLCIQICDTLIVLTANVSAIYSFFSLYDTKRYTKDLQSTARYTDKEKDDLPNRKIKIGGNRVFILRS